MKRNNKQVILKGIIEKTFNGFVCVRGYAEKSVLTKISVADGKYQRDLDKKQVKELKAFLSEGNYMFFPEIILSMTLYFDYEKYRKDRLQQDPNKGIEPYNAINQIYSKEGFKSNKINLTIKADKNQLATITIGHDFSTVLSEINKSYYLKRIDGNHRLTALEQLSDPLKDKAIPFCIILLTDDLNAQKSEYVLFNNINSKAKPLTNYENVKGIISGLFSDEELQNPKDFNPHYYYIKQYVEAFRENNFFKMQSIIKNENELIKFVFDLLDLCDRNFVPYKSKDFSKKINKIIIKYEEVFKQHQNQMIGIMLLILKGYDIDDIVSWLRKAEINVKVPNDIFVTLFMTYKTSVKKDIFYSLAISAPGAQDHFNAVQRAVNRINNEYKKQLNLIRIDLFKQGESFSILDKIVECIKNSGLLIADLTSDNSNVAHEIGFMMGYNEALNKELSDNLLITITKSENGNTSKNIPSNIRHHRAVYYTDNTSLEEEIFEELKAKYCR